MFAVLKLHDLTLKDTSTLTYFFEYKFNGIGLFSILNWSTRDFRVKK